jgi:molybdopterin converting factor small subunit
LIGYEPASTMTTRILFFGRFGERFGREIDLELPAGGCTVGELRAMLVARSADESLARRSVAICVDRAVAWDDAIIRPGQEIAVLPPLSGG